VAERTICAVADDPDGRGGEVASTLRTRSGGWPAHQPRRTTMTIGSCALCITVSAGSPVPVRLSNHAEGAPGRSQLGTGEVSATLPKPASVGVSSQCMKGERIRYQQTGEFHFLTFSCFRRRSYLSMVAAMELLHKGEAPACRGGSRSLIFTRIAPDLCFSILLAKSLKGTEHEHRPSGTPDEFLVSPTPR